LDIIGRKVTNYSEDKAGERIKKFSRYTVWDVHPFMNLPFSGKHSFPEEIL
jgi:hypothetical protein